MTAETAALRISQAVDALQLAADRRHDRKEVTVAASDLDLLLRRLEALETTLTAVRETLTLIPEDALGYEMEGDPEVATMTLPVRDRELWQLDRVIASGLSARGRVRTAEVPEAQFDVMVPLQEDLVLQFCNEIGEARDRGCSIDAVRLLEMAHALYRAEIDDRIPEAHEETAGAAQGRAILGRIAGGLRALPHTEWRYPANDSDDWGYVRTDTVDDHPGPVVAQARSGKWDTVEELNLHRSNATDPYAPVARHLVNCQPSSIKAVLALVQALDDDILRLRRLDQEYARLESWIVLNSDFDQYSSSFGTVDRLIRSLERMKSGKKP